MRKFFASLATCVACFIPAAQANTLTTDFTDLWWIPAEDGWGVNIIQQQDILFVTLFVYGQNNVPVWYVGSAIQYQGVVNGQFTFTGPLYQVNGPWFGGAFNPANVSHRQVGALTFRTGAATTATLTYTVDGTSVTKNIERQTWRNQDFAGSYRGAVVGTYTGCSSGNGPYESPAILTVTQNNTQITIHEAGNNNFTCTYTGTYTAAGNSGLANGGGTCSDGIAQTWTASEMKVGLDFFAAAFEARIGTSCLFTGRIGGVRRN
jgi:hypothetical protein